MATYAGAWSTKTRAAPSGTLGRGPADPVDVGHAIPPTDLGMDAAVVMAPPQPDSGQLAERLPGYSRGGPPNPPIDRTPDDHRIGAEGQRQGTWRAHDKDQGAARARQYGPLPAWSVHHREATTRVETLPVSMGSTRQLKYAATSRADNLADSRNGFETARWIFDKFRYAWRRPDMRPVHFDGAWNPADSPPLPEQLGSPYASPYPTLGHGRRRTGMTPQVRRVPRPWDEAARVDGTETATGGQFQSWGL